MQPGRLLLVEDNPGDVFMFTRAATSAASNMIISVAGDAKEAFAFAEEVTKRGEPITVIVTDLKMPRTSGIELIAKLRGHFTSQVLPVILLSSSITTGTCRMLTRPELAFIWLTQLALRATKI